MLRIAGGILLLALALPAPAQEQPKEKDKDKEATAAQQYKALVKEYQDAYQAWLKTYTQAKTNEDRVKTFGSRPVPDKYAAKFLELAEKHPKDPAAVDALVWIVSNTVAAGADAPRTKAFAVLERDHLKSAKLGEVCNTLMYRGGKESEQFLRAVLEQNPHREMQGIACLALAQGLKRAAGQKEMPKEVEELFERAAQKYGDVKLPYRGTVGDRAKAELFEVRFLAIGMTVPEVEGEDQDGVKFKLSDYRGKVVLIDFWGNW